MDARQDRTEREKQFDTQLQASSKAASIELFLSHIKASSDRSQNT